MFKSLSSLVAKGIFYLTICSRCNKIIGYYAELTIVIWKNSSHLSGNLSDFTRPRSGLWMSVVLLATVVIVIEGLMGIGSTLFAVDGTYWDSAWLKLLGLAK